MNKDSIANPEIPKMKKFTIFYSLFKNVKKINDQDSFYSYCLDHCDRDGLALDVGADMCLGLTQSLLKHDWQDQIYCFDLWTRRKPEEQDKVHLIQGDAISNLKVFLKKMDRKIGIIEIDIRGIELEMFHPDDMGLDFENNKTEQILDVCMDYVSENTVIIIAEFHSHDESGTGFQSDAYALARSFSKFNLRYECLCYGSTDYLKSAWRVVDQGSLSRNDLLKMLRLFKNH